MQLLTQFFCFDFSIQGGAIGAYDTGIQIPAGAIVVSPDFSCISLQGVLNTPTFALGTSITPGAFWTLTSGFSPLPTWDTFSLLGTNYLMDNSLHVIFTISTKTMNGGKIISMLQYFIP